MLAILCFYVAADATDAGICLPCHFEILGTDYFTLQGGPSSKVKWPHQLIRLYKGATLTLPLRSLKLSLFQSFNKSE